MYIVKVSPYCGLSMPVDTCETEMDARGLVADILRRARRKGRPIAVIEPRKVWEICEPDGAHMVPDDCGTVRIQHITYDCRECGFSHESRDDAMRCCTDIPEEFECYACGSIHYSARSCADCCGQDAE